jgi:hypothetical protein
MISGRALSNMRPRDIADAAIGCEGCHDLGCVVGAAIVNDDQFPIGKALRLHATDGRADQIGTIPCRHHDGDGRGRERIAITAGAQKLRMFEQKQFQRREPATPRRFVVPRLSAQAAEKRARKAPPGPKHDFLGN